MHHIEEGHISQYVVHLSVTVPFWKGCTSRELDCPEPIVQSRRAAACEHEYSLHYAPKYSAEVYCKAGCMEIGGELTVRDSFLCNTMRKIGYAVVFYLYFCGAP